MDGTLRYEQVAGQLRAQIHSGALAAGERVPSVRAMSRQARVSVATVIEAYARLEAQGVIEARPQSGFYVRPSLAPPIEAPPSLARPRPRPIANQLLAQVFDIYSRAVVPLHLAAPDPSLLPTARIAALTRDLLKRPDYQRAGYLHPAGLPALRRQIARRLSLAGAQVTADDVVITAGALEAISLSLQVLTKAGDVVLVETPTYYGLLQALQLRGLQVVEVPNHCCSGIDVECALRSLREQPIKVAVLTPSFNNPNGSCMPDAARRALLAACAERGVLVIEDDVYGELAFSGQRPTPLLALDRDSNVLLCGSASKTVGPGLRMGWAVAPRWRDALLQAKAFHSCGAPTLAQFVTAEFYASVSLERSMRRLRETIAANVRRFSDAVARWFPPGTAVSRPQGGLTLWLELPPQVDSHRLFEAGVEAGVGSLPGTLFSASGAWRHHLRLSCALPWTPVVEQALRTLGGLARGLAGTVGEAVA